MLKLLFNCDHRRPSPLIQWCILHIPPYFLKIYKFSPNSAKFNFWLTLRFCFPLFWPWYIYASGNCNEGLAQDPYGGDPRARFEPTTLRCKGFDSTNAPPRPAGRPWLQLLLFSFHILTTSHSSSFFRRIIYSAFNVAIILIILFFKRGPYPRCFPRFPVALYSQLHLFS